MVVFFLLKARVRLTVAFRIPWAGLATVLLTDLCLATPAPPPRPVPPTCPQAPNTLLERLQAFPSLYVLLLTGMPSALHTSG